MTPQLRERVRQRAEGSCEYCQLKQGETILPHEVDHIRAQKHHGDDSFENLCLSCAYCNAAKGSNIAGYDPLSQTIVPLYNPRNQTWSDHFSWRDSLLQGNTSSARATIDVLKINAPERIEHRRMLELLRNSAE